MKDSICDHSILSNLQFNTENYILDESIARPYKRHTQERRNPMTVCIAAICKNKDGYYIVGASDKMITAGDIEFEPMSSSPSKIISISSNSSNIVALTAGDTSTQAEIIQSVKAAIAAKVSTQTISVKDVVDEYVLQYDGLRSKRINSQILSKFGLDEKSFISQQSHMAESFVNNLTREIYNYNLPGVATIIAGGDGTGGFGVHLYSIFDNHVMCCDPVGYAAVGGGGRHASSQFMQARHSTSSDLNETILLTYLAKKRSEVAPGVGKETDMIMVHSSGITIISSEIISKLDEIVNTINKGMDGIISTAKNSVKI